MLTAPEFSKFLWAEVANTAVYLINRSPIKAFPDSITSYELFYGKRSSYLYLRIFEYAVYILDPHAKKAGKLAVRLEKL
jgi:predicted nucleic acid-binding protein